MKGFADEADPTTLRMSKSGADRDVWETSASPHAPLLQSLALVSRLTSQTYVHRLRRRRHK